MLNKMLFRCAVATGVLLMGCAYGPPEKLEKDMVLITIHDQFLFGMLKKMVVCKVSSEGLENCSEKQSP